VGALNRQILEEMQRQRELIERLMGEHASRQPEPAPEEEQRVAGLMTDYDCLLICTSDDVLGAIDRWNRSRKAKSKRLPH